LEDIIDDELDLPEKLPGARLDIRASNESLGREKP
jgi:hypothetical protein